MREIKSVFGLDYRLYFLFYIPLTDGQSMGYNYIILKNWGMYYDKKKKIIIVYDVVVITSFT